MHWLFDLPSPIGIIIILPVEFGIIALVMFGLKKLGVNIREVWFQGIKNAFFMSLIILAVIGLMTIVPLLGFGKSIYVSLKASYGVIWSGIFCWAYFNLFTNKQKAGQELLDVAPIPNGVIFFIIGVITVILGILGFVDFVLEGSKFSWLASVVIGVTTGAYFINMGFSRIQIHENGILAYVDLIKWNRIESFEWVDDNGKAYTLKLRYKGKTPEFLRSGAVPVPVEKKVQLDSLLERYLSEVVSMQNRA